MKARKLLHLMAIIAGFLSVSFISRADDTKPAKPRPYILKNCIVSDEKLGGDMGEPFVFIYKDKMIKNDPGREIKFCCKSCLKDFNKDPAGYIKKLDAAEAKLKDKK